MTFNEALISFDAVVLDACVKAGHKNIYVQYSAYQYAGDSVVVNNINDVAVTGKIIINQPPSVWSEIPYTSKIIENPTWLDLCVLANEMINTIKDYHHVFLESIHRATKNQKDNIPPDVEVYSFDMGS